MFSSELRRFEIIGYPGLCVSSQDETHTTYTNTGEPLNIITTKYSISVDSYRLSQDVAPLMIPHVNQQITEQLDMQLRFRVKELMKELLKSELKLDIIFWRDEDSVGLTAQALIDGELITETSTQVPV